MVGYVSSIYTISDSFISSSYSSDTDTYQYIISDETKYYLMGVKVNGKKLGVTKKGKR